MANEQVYDDEVIKQDDTRGPGWFLKIAYIVISLFCVYYLITFWNWKSSYEEQQDKIQMQLKK